eukprot:scaffold140655_cov22-Tisochrysis_lutea.AAC.1
MRPNCLRYYPCVVFHTLAKASGRGIREGHANHLNIVPILTCDIKDVNDGRKAQLQPNSFPPGRSLAKTGSQRKALREYARTGNEMHREHLNTSAFINFQALAAHLIIYN